MKLESKSGTAARATSFTPFWLKALVTVFGAHIGTALSLCPREKALHGAKALFGGKSHFWRESPFVAGERYSPVQKSQMLVTQPAQPDTPSPMPSPMPAPMPPKSMPLAALPMTPPACSAP
ncbi:hypothetical protein T492DRAFT_263153 [Pavlovales sp. CCMP2436]|nr:hypothetical protein T492DRAFT_263153 [Pavlovales sp. CCMP2436]